MRASHCATRQASNSTPFSCDTTDKRWDNHDTVRERDISKDQLTQKKFNFSLYRLRFGVNCSFKDLIIHAKKVIQLIILVMFVLRG